MHALLLYAYIFPCHTHLVVSSIYVHLSLNQFVFFLCSNSSCCHVSVTSCSRAFVVLCTNPFVAHNIWRNYYKASSSMVAVRAHLEGAACYFRTDLCSNSSCCHVSVSSCSRAFVLLRTNPFVARDICRNCYKASSSMVAVRAHLEGAACCFRTDCGYPERVCMPLWFSCVVICCVSRK